MFKLDPIQWAKLAAIVALLAYGWYIFDSRQDALAEVGRLTAQIQAQADLAAADEARKAAAYAEAKRKADNEAKDLLGRIAWLKRQNGKGCESAERVIKEYRGAK